MDSGFSLGLGLQEEDSEEEEFGLGEGLEDRDSLELEEDTSREPIFSQLQSLASGISDSYIASKRQLKRQSPFEMARNVPSKFKRSSTDFLGWSNSVLEEIEKEDDVHKSLASQGKVRHRISNPDFRRRWYATGPPPSLSIPAEFSSILDPSKKVPPNRKVLFSLAESQSLYQQSFFALEANSFISWHLGSLGTFLQDAISALEQGETEGALKKFQDMFSFLSSLDRAVSDSIACLVPSVSAWVLRLREHYLSFTSPNLSNLSKSKALYDKLDFRTLFNVDLLKSFQEEIKVSSTAELNRKLSLALRPSFVSRSSTPVSRGFSSSRPQYNRSRGSRPFRGTRGRVPSRGKDKQFRGKPRK